MISKAFSVAMISIGSFLEIWFYYARFKQDGIPVWLCWIIATGLNLLLNLFVYNFRKTRWLIILIIALGSYSVFSTSAGQTFMLLSLETNEATDLKINVLNKNVDILNEAIDRLNAESVSINATLGTIQDIEHEANYRTTVRGARDRLSEIDHERSELLAKLIDLTTGQETVIRESIKATSIYDFYGSMVEWNNTNWLKFIFHTVLSIFIAIMAPTGILTWESKKKKEVANQPIGAVIQPYIPKRYPETPGLFD